jgi:hypothetical protein
LRGVSQRVRILSRAKISPLQPEPGKPHSFVVK